MKLKGRIKVRAVLTTKTGLHIGGTKDTYEIGALDNPIIKIVRGDSPNRQEPYIPGSSLKGKIRSLIEESDKDGNFCTCGTCLICKMFGSGPEAKEAQKPRLKVRDAFLSDSNEEKLRQVDFVEIKTENRIDRKTGKAEHPREMERVLPGTKFDLEFIISLYDDDNAGEYLGLLMKGLKLLSHDYLGGCGTRGYGKIEISNIEISTLKASDYEGDATFKLYKTYKEIGEIKADDIKNCVV
jgi:CRISPR-associated protein Csm3